ncbi:uncharacterized protein LOC134101239 [Sardina pilchardus]|uniref:uncharacterized protein LOC134101239 n=1 Tax=Sardina pilchardus TaxID=27697 RepID=UPI002E0EB733
MVAMVLLGCGQEAGEGPFMETLHVTSQLTHQQAQMTKLSWATQAACKDRRLLLKHLADIETQRAATVQLQKQAEAYRKASEQDTKVLRPEVQHIEARTFDLLGEHQEMVDKSSEDVQYNEVSTKKLHNLPLAKQGELEETFQKKDLLLVEQGELEETSQKKDLLLVEQGELEETSQKKDLLLVEQGELEETSQKKDLLLVEQGELEETFQKDDLLLVDLSKS